MFCISDTHHKQKKAMNLEGEDLGHRGEFGGRKEGEIFVITILKIKLK